MSLLLKRFYCFVLEIIYLELDQIGLYLFVFLQGRESDQLPNVRWLGVHRSLLQRCVLVCYAAKSRDSLEHHCSVNYLFGPDSLTCLSCAVVFSRAEFEGCGTTQFESSPNLPSSQEISTALHH